MLADVKGTCSPVTFVMFATLSCSTKPIIFQLLQVIQVTGMESSKMKVRETIWYVAKLACNDAWV